MATKPEPVSTHQREAIIGEIVTVLPTLSDEALCGLLRGLRAPILQRNPTHLRYHAAPPESPSPSSVPGQ